MKITLLENSSLVAVLFITKRNWSQGHGGGESLQRMETHSLDDVLRETDLARVRAQCGSKPRVTLSTFFIYMSQ